MRIRVGLRAPRDYRLRIVFGRTPVGGRPLQPGERQLSGQLPGSLMPRGLWQRCDFSSGPACPTAGDTCNPNPNGGCPKYGDYNGNTCQFGRLYTIWPSATNQPGAIQGTGGNIDLFYSSQIIHAPPTAKCKDVTVSAGPTCTASTSIDNGSNDPDGEAVTLAQSPPGPMHSAIQRLP